MSSRLLILMRKRGGSTLLLDTVTGAVAAYSLRKLRTAYSGSAIRVRRNSDNAEQDIGFVSGVLDTASLLTFCGAGSGFVTTWYDQVGSNNATQSTSTAQPRIVLNGVLDSSGGITGLYTAGASRLNVGDLSASFPTAATLCSVQNITNLSCVYSTKANSTWWRWVDNNAYSGVFVDLRQGYPTPGVSTGWTQVSIESNSSKYEWLQNQSTMGSGTVDYDAGNSHVIAAASSAGINGMYGYLAEIILLSTVASARNTIASDQMSYYGIS